MAVVLQELFTGMLIERLRASHNWMGRLQDKSSFVGNNVIHLDEIGADPDVLINNTVYPIATAARQDDGIAVSLNKYDTTNTSCSDDELYALPYDKPGSIIAQHKGTLEERMGGHGLYSLAPANNSRLPILITSGPDDGTGRKMLIPADLIRLQRVYDDAKIPKLGRILILSNEHVQDLLTATLATHPFLASQFQNIATGGLAPVLYGFELFQDLYAPLYDVTTKTRKAFGSVQGASDMFASVALSVPDAFRAYGTYKMYYRIADIDPETRKTVAGFRVWGIASPLTRRSQSAIISGKV